MAAFSNYREKLRNVVFHSLSLFFCHSEWNGVEIVLNEEHIVFNFLLLGEGDLAFMAPGDERDNRSVTSSLIHSSLVIHPPSKRIALLHRDEGVFLSSSKEAPR